MPVIISKKGMFLQGGICVQASLKKTVSVNSDGMSHEEEVCVLTDVCAEPTSIVLDWNPSDYFEQPNFVSVGDILSCLSSGNMPSVFD